MAFSAGDVRFESTFTMDAELFKQYVSARDRSLNKRDGAALAAVMAVLAALYLWGTLSVGVLTPWGVCVGALILAALAYALALAFTGFTLFWPRRSWEKTRAHYFARHGAEGADSFTLRTSACLNEARTCVLKEGRPAGMVGKPYQKFSHVEETADLVVLVSDFGEVGSILHNMFSADYAEKLERRANAEDMVFAKAGLEGGDAAQLAAYLRSKLGHRA